MISFIRFGLGGGGCPRLRPGGGGGGEGGPNLDCCSLLSSLKTFSVFSIALSSAWWSEYHRFSLITEI